VAGGKLKPYGGDECLRDRCLVGSGETFVEPNLSHFILQEGDRPHADIDLRIRAVAARWIILGPRGPEFYQRGAGWPTGAPLDTFEPFLNAVPEIAFAVADIADMLIVTEN